MLTQIVGVLFISACVLAEVFQKTGIDLIRQLALIETMFLNFQNAKPFKAIAVLSDPNGGPVRGNVTFTQNGCGNPVLVEVSIDGLKPGPKGFHIHEKGDLSNGCLSTGGHYNPDKVIWFANEVRPTNFDSPINQKN